MADDSPALDDDFSSDDTNEDDTGSDRLMRDLTAEEMDKLVQLQDMTGMEDLAICRALLESKDWDLEATAREQLGIPNERRRAEEAPDRPIAPPPVAPNARVVRNHARHRGARGSLWTTLFDWSYYLFTLPVMVPFQIIQSVFGVFSAVLGMQNAVQGPRGDRRANNVRHDAAADVRKFKETFERSFGAEHPTFMGGSYSQALEEAKRDLRFLVVYLHCAQHQDTETFCRETLADPSVREHLQANNVLFWGCSVDTTEGHRVSQAMRECTYPFLAVIVLRQNKMMIVGRVEGHCPPEQLTRRLEEIVRDNEAYVVAARIDRDERSRNQSIREEQDAAFQETLRQDQEIERKKREEEEEKKRQEEEERRLIREEQERKDKIRQLKIDLVSEIPDEPEESHPDVVRILIKLPGGQRLTRRFLKTESLKALYLYVFCHPDSPDEFDITTNFPKKVLHCKPEDEPGSFEEAGLGQSTMLFVNDLEA